MKGMLDFLERAGLVKKDPPASADLTTAAPVAEPVPVPIVFGPVTETTLSLEAIYASAGVPASQYPAERLLRLVDGLSAMDAATRNMAIRAMDAADESWSIDDPLADAAVKSAALAAHAERLQADLQHLESETRTRLEALRLKQEQTATEIGQQIAELQALLAREQARGTQESAAQEADLAAARDQTARQLAQIAQASERLQSLAVQFGPAPTDPPTQE